MFEIVSIPVYATIPTAIPSAKSPQLGAVPRSIWVTSRSALKTSASPMITSTIWVSRSAIASTRLSRADSSVPLTLSRASSATSPTPKMTSPGP